MSLTADVIDASTWGTGYGSTRHLIDKETALGSAGPRSRCRSGEYRLDYLDGDSRNLFGSPLPQGVYVLRKRPCKACAKLAVAEGIEVTP